MQPPPLDAACEDSSPDSAYVDTDLYCVGCGYNLRTLAVAAVCPECGLPVQDSVVSDAEVEWLRRVRRGFAWLMVTNGWNLLTTGLFLCFSFLPPIRAVAVYQCSQYGTMLVDVLELVAVFMVTRYSPYVPTDLRPLRSFTRTLLVAAVILMFAHRTIFLFSSLYFALDIGTRYAFYALSLLVNVASTCLLLVYVRGLMRNRHISTETWFVPALGAILFCLLAGETSVLTGYRSELQRQGGAGQTVYSATQLLFAATRFAYVVNHVLLILYFRRCRAGLASIVKPHRAPHSQARASLVQSPV